MTTESEQIFEAYLDVSTTGSGKIMLEDIRRAFIELTDPTLSEELDEIPHPYRAYVERGMRLVVQKIEGTIALAEQYRIDGYPEEESNDEPEL